jgi:hypothetical protein
MANLILIWTSPHRGEPPWSNRPMPQAGPNARFPDSIAAIQTQLAVAIACIARDQAAGPRPMPSIKYNMEATMTILFPKIHRQKVRRLASPFFRWLNAPGWTIFS